MGTHMAGSFCRPILSGRARGIKLVPRGTPRSDYFPIDPARPLPREFARSKLLAVDAIAEELDTKLNKWKPELSREVRALVSQVIDAADNDTLDLMRSRAVEQEVLDQLDEPTAR